MSVDGRSPSKANGLDEIRIGALVGDEVAGVIERRAAAITAMGDAVAADPAVKVRLGTPRTPEGPLRSVGSLLTEKNRVPVQVAHFAAAPRPFVRAAERFEPQHERLAPKVAAGRAIEVVEFFVTERADIPGAKRAQARPNGA